MSLSARTTESLSARPWNASQPPARFLIMRMHAAGDVAITLPYCSALREQFPSAQIDFLTTATCAGLPEALTIFNNVHVLPFMQGSWSRLFNTMRWSATIARHRYDVVIDLQRNWVSRALRRAARPHAWAEFNRKEPKPAGERTLDSIASAGFFVVPSFKMRFLSLLETSAAHLLRTNGWDGDQPLIVLNPAGLFPTRNWPAENFLHLAKLWLKQEPVRFLILGTDRVKEKARFLKNELGDSLIDLVGVTSLAEAFAVLQHTACVVSEDSGLMHMAWVSGIPTVALFGSSRHDWSRPLGAHSICLHSGDLECGSCMSPACRYGDVHCLTRHTPEYVFEVARRAISRPWKETATA